MTEIAFSSVKVITGDQLPGVRGLCGHLLHTVTFLVFFFCFFLFFFFTCHIDIEGKCERIIGGGGGGGGGGGKRYVAPFQNYWGPVPFHHPSPLSLLTPMQFD